MKKINSLILLLLGTFSFICIAQDFKVEEQKIRFLITEVKKSEAQFFRNGDEHTSKKAAEHLEYKWKRAKKPYIFFGDERFLTVDQFIEHIASKSSTTGKNYHIKPKGGEKTTTEKWLRSKLKSFPGKGEKK